MKGAPESLISPRPRPRSVRRGRCGRAGLTDDVCDEIGEAIAVNTKVVQMDLSDNLIANDGAQHLAEALKQNNSLRIFKCVSATRGEESRPDARARHPFRPPPARAD